MSRLQKRSVHTISYMADGASVERILQHRLINNAIERKSTRQWAFSSPIDTRTKETVSAPLLDDGKPCVYGEDVKHSRKNGRGSVQSGAHTLGIGSFVAGYWQLKKLMESPDSPLLRADIVNVDKQDDRAAARLFLSAALDHLSRTQPTEIGLAV